MRMLLLATSSLVLMIFPVTAANLKKHELTVAASSALNVSNDEVDAIVKEMTRIAQRKDYGWDVPCADVEFVRKGNVISSALLPITGTFEDVRNISNSIAPRPNVVITLDAVTCAGVRAAGCTQVDQEPMVVSLHPTFDGTIWLHERGHSMGRNHAEGEGQPGATQPEQFAKRVMFWQVSPRNFGLNANECQAFRETIFASVVSTAAPLIAAAELAPDVVKNNTIGLTDRAYQVVVLPWLHGMPVDEVNALDQNDLSSIRAMLAGSPNSYWPNALSVLAFRGDVSDAALINKAINLPVAATIDGLQSIEEKQAFRALLSIKIRAPEALGILANKTQNGQLVDQLKQIATVPEAKNLTKNDLAADALSKSALRGLALSGLPSADSIVRSPGSQTGAPGLTSKEIDNIRNLSGSVKQFGLDRTLRQMQ